MPLTLDELSVKFSLDASQRAHLRRCSLDLDDVSQRLEAGAPFDYAVGTSCFMGYEFAVDARVLIPRHETELLVEAAEEIIAGRSCDVLDVGTGSGAIAVSLALRNPFCRVSACDISCDALAVARGNARRLGADIRFFESDLLTNASGQFDLIVSNPPYVADSYVATHCAHTHEPKLALDGGKDGMELIARLIAQAHPMLTDGGHLLIEMGYDQKAQVASVAEANGFAVAKTVHDYNGHARHMILKKRNVT